MEGPTFELWVATHASGPSGQPVQDANLFADRHESLVDLLARVRQRILSPPSPGSPGSVDCPSPGGVHFNAIVDDQQARLDSNNALLAFPISPGSSPSLYDVRLWFSTDPSTDWQLVDVDQQQQQQQQSAQVRQVCSLQIGDISVMRASAPRLLLEVRPRVTDPWVRQAPPSRASSNAEINSNLNHRLAGPGSPGAPGLPSPYGTAAQAVEAAAAAYALHGGEVDPTLPRVDDSANSDSKWRAGLKVGDAVDVYDDETGDWREGAIESVGMVAAATAAARAVAGGGDGGAAEDAVIPPVNALVLRFRGEQGHRLCTSRLAGAPAEVAEEPKHGDIAPPYVCGIC